MGNPFLDRAAKRSSGAHGNKAERSAAKSLKAQRVPGSGAIASQKGDIRKATKHFKFLMESKATLKDSFSVKKEWLTKIADEALEVGMTPALVFQFTDALGNMQRPGIFVAIPEATFLEMLELLEQQAP